MKKSLRVKRVEETIFKQLSLILENYLRDLDFPITTIVGVNSDPGLQLVKVKVSVYGDKLQKEKVLDYLTQKKKHIRYLLAGKIRIKYMPDLEFLEDTSIDMLNKIEKIIEAEKKSDQDN
ncbi:MAG: hypothetical protein APR63_04340 [Desulfuromonas sp. SDB]|nr:MAG: hypothetical protein APR63_04340 [Desulfuromonas sp. SDB]